MTGVSFGGGGPQVGPGLAFGSGVSFGKPAVEDPLAGVEYTESLESDAATELTALEQGYRKRRGMDADRFRAATDSEYWFAVCFKSRAEKEAFLAEFSASALGDKYIDGAALTRLLRKR